MNYVNELEIEAAHSDNMAAMAQYWMGAAHRAEREKVQTIIALVIAAGGEISIPMSALNELPGKELILEHIPYNNTTRFWVRNST